MKKIIFAALGLSFCFQTLPAQAYSDKIYKDLAKFSKVLEIVDKYYVTQPEEQKLMQGAIQGMLFSLDPHTVYLPADVYKNFKSDTEGRFGGIGIEVDSREGILTVVSPVEDSPAARAGIMADDKILSIDGKSTKGMDLEEAVREMRGPLGHKVTLGIWHKGQTNIHQVPLVREVIKVQSVKVEDLGDNYVGLRITSFQEGTAREFHHAVEKFRNEHDGKLAGILMDLRDNPGGLLDEAVKLCDLFLNKGPIVSTRGRQGPPEVQEAHERGTYPHFPMLVLVNGSSASAAEIVSGALQDTDRAKLIGSKTYGKGSVQTIVNLEDGDALKITIAHYYTPKGRMIDGKGIDPDILLDEKTYEKANKGNVPKKLKERYKAFREYQKQVATATLKKMK